MKAKTLVKKVVVGIAVVCISAGYVRADKLQLQAKLSKEVRIELRDVTIAGALEQIGNKAGVTFVLSDEAAWKLPQGEATRLSVMMQGPLAESTTEMLNAFFMRYAVGDEEITIYPRPELDHVLGRPTTKQLQLLKAIYTKPIRTYYVNKVQTSINEALGSEVLVSPITVHPQLNNLLRQLVGKSPILAQNRNRARAPRLPATQPPPEELVEAEPTEYDLPTPVTLVQLLSQVSIDRQGPESTRWYIAGMDFPGQNPEIRVLTRPMFADLKLNQKIDISYKEAGLDKILQDLASRAGVRLVVARGSYLNEHTLSASMQNIAIEQAVRSVVDMVGAQCEVGGNGIEIGGLAKRKSTPPPRSVKDKTRGKVDSEGYVGKISIPMDGGAYYIEFMLREKDLTDELRKLWQEKLKSILHVPTVYELPKAGPPSEPAEKGGGVGKKGGSR